MNNFFDSDIIQNELKEINDLQKDMYESVLSFAIMSRENKLEHIEKLEKLIEKQQIMYTRLSLSDDPQASEMKMNLQKSIELLGFPPNTDMKTLFNSMTQTIKSLKHYLDA